MCAECACDTASTTAIQADEKDAKIYTVSGMTCGHCVSSVSEEISEIGGVSGVRVDLSTGAVTVTGAGFSDEEIDAAVERAGYRLAAI